MGLQLQLSNNNGAVLLVIWFREINTPPKLVQIALHLPNSSVIPHSVYLWWISSGKFANFIIAKLSWQT